MKQIKEIGSFARCLYNLTATRLRIPDAYIEVVGKDYVPVLCGYFCRNFCPYIKKDGMTYLCTYEDIEFSPTGIDRKCI